MCQPRATNDVPPAQPIYSRNTIQLTDMAFLKSIKRAFGFDAEEIEDDFPEGIDATVTPLKERMAAIPQQPDSAADAGADRSAAAVDVPPEDCPVSAADDAGRRLIFSHAVRLINESLPGFLSSAINPEEQERYLLNALDDGMRQYLSEIGRASCRERVYVLV